MAVYRAEHPSYHRLPHVPARPLAEAVVAPPPGFRLTTIGPIVEASDARHPQVVEYIGCYSNMPGDACAAIDVRVTDYPTSEWAAYALRGTPTAGFDGSAIGTEAVVTKYGPPVLEARTDPQARAVYWRSGTTVVHIRGWLVPMDDVIRAYVARYPSSR